MARCVCTHPVHVNGKCKGVWNVAWDGRWVDLPWWHYNPVIAQWELWPVRRCGCSHG